MENEFTNVVQSQSAPDPNKEVMSLGSWLITLLIFAIPCVNVVVYLVWAFGNGNENRKNYCRAALIFMLIGVVLSLAFGSMLSASLVSMYS